MSVYAEIRIIDTDYPHEEEKPYRIEPTYIKLNTVGSSIMTQYEFKIVYNTIDRHHKIQTENRRGEMVSLDICEGNPGALAFVMDAYNKLMFKAENAFQKMQDANIKGSKLYMIWNDCCNRNTERAIDMILDNNVDTINHFINYEHGRGLRYCPENFPGYRKEE